jgi:oxygen-independent coproporphyrinogen-3 oxidase
MTAAKFDIKPTRRDRFVFQYPPFESMKPGETPPFWEPAAGQPAKEGFQLYVHIPFCAVRCTFCYYGIMPNTFRTVVDPYVDALHKEIDLVADLPYLQDREVETVYFGGGTPTYLKEDQLEALVEHLRRRFKIADNVEWTSEGEPTTIQESKLKLLKDLGITRMSFGIQSFHPDVAKINGRIAKPHVVERTLEWAKEANFRVTNLDLMSGMLGETMETWKHSIDTILDYEPEHITIYRMEIKPGTQFYTKLQFDPELRKQFVGDEPELEMLEYAEERFAQQGYQHHTHFSWILKPEHEHTHRTNCWRGKDLIALGESSFGFAGGYLYQNCNPYRPYIKVVNDGEVPVACGHKLSKKEEMTGYMVMGMKLLGVSRSDFRARFGEDAVDIFPEELAYLEDQGVVTVNDEAINVTHHGCNYADSYLRVFYPQGYIQLDEMTVNTPDFTTMPLYTRDVSQLVSIGKHGEATA